MTLNDIQQLFNRASLHCFERTKLCLVAVVMALCGALVAFFQTIGEEVSQWVGMSMIFLPLFLCAGILLAAGIFLIRIYHDEVKLRKLHYGAILEQSWDLISMAFYAALPAVLCYFVIWMTLGIFLLLKELPGIGSFLGAILAFTPFILNLSVILLALASVFVLFFFAPLIAFKGVDRVQLTTLFVKRIRYDVFYNGLLCAIALSPLLCSLAVLTGAFYLTTSLYVSTVQPAPYQAVQSFILMLPFAILLTPSTIFFFNFSAEAHVYMHKMMRHSDKKLDSING